MDSTVDLDHLRRWIGRSEQRTDTIGATPMAALSATLDRDDAPPQLGDALPPLWHWLYFLPLPRAGEIGDDGHPRRGGFLPPVPLPRRMWAGGRLVFQDPVRVGDVATRTSTVHDVGIKHGRSGDLVFVTVQHRIDSPRGLALTEEHDIVYRGAARPGDTAAAPQPARADAAFSREIVPDAVLLFRYSALTFNGHRIHHDRRYATGVEGYPGLVVHGPLIATLLLDLLRRRQPQATVRRFDFKALRPTFDLHQFHVCGRPDGERRCMLWAHDHEGWLTMQASAETA